MSDKQNTITEVDENSKSTQQKANNNLKDTQWFSYKDLDKYTNLSEKSWHRILAGALEEDKKYEVENGRRVIYFNKNYIDVKTQENYNNSKSFQDLLDEQSKIDNENLQNKENSQEDNKVSLEVYKETIRTKGELIEEFKDRVLKLENQLNEKDKQIKALTDALEKSQTITSQQQSLSLKQNEHTALLLDKSKNSGLLGWFGFGSKGKQEKEAETQEI